MLGAGSELDREYRAVELLQQPEIMVKLLAQLDMVAAWGTVDETVMEQIEIQTKYEGYIVRQQAEIARQRRHEETFLPANFNYQAILSFQLISKQKFIQVKPTTIGQASRIPGITPAAISILLVYLKKPDFPNAPRANTINTGLGIKH